MRRRIRTGRASRLGRRIRCAICVAFCVAFCGVYSLADSGERRKPRRTGHFGVRGGQDKECVLKLPWPSTAEYRMMKLKKDILATVRTPSTNMTKNMAGRAHMPCKLPSTNKSRYLLQPRPRRAYIQFRCSSIYNLAS